MFNPSKLELLEALKTNQSFPDTYKEEDPQSIIYGLRSIYVSQNKLNYDTIFGTNPEGVLKLFYDIAAAAPLNLLVNPLVQYEPLYERYDQKTQHLPSSEINFVNTWEEAAEFNNTYYEDYLEGHSQEDELKNLQYILETLFNVKLDDEVYEYETSTLPLEDGIYQPVVNEWINDNLLEFAEKYKWYIMLVCSCSGVPVSNKPCLTTDCANMRRGDMHTYINLHLEDINVDDCKEAENLSDRLELVLFREKDGNTYQFNNTPRQEVYKDLMKSTIKYKSYDGVSYKLTSFNVDEDSIHGALVDYFEDLNINVVKSNLL